MKLINRIYANFIAILFVSTLASSVIGAVLVTRAVRSEAISRVERGLAEAWISLEDQLETLSLSSRILAEGLGEHLTLPLDPDFEMLFPGPLPAFLEQVASRASEGYLLLKPDQLEILGYDIGNRDLQTCADGSLLCLFALGSGGQGTALAGQLLNGNYDLVVQVQESLFGRELYGDKPFGTVTVFCGDTRVATTVLGPDGKIAVGTKVSAVVKEKVLVKGERWLNRALVVDEWYLSAYEPIKNPADQAIGILYVGVLEQKYTNITRRAIVLLASLSIPILGLVLVAALLITRRVVGPLSTLASASESIARESYDFDTGPIRGDEEINALVSAFRNMTDAIKVREQRLKSQNIDLERANTDYQELLSFVTHELNNSVGSLLLNASVLEEDARESFSPDQREVVDQILRDIERFRDMVRNYLNLSRLEKGTLRYRPGPLNLRNRVIEPVLKRLSRWIAHKRVEIIWAWDDEVLVNGDPDLLDIAFSNFLTNALKYGDKWIRFSCQLENGQWLISISNGGRPIAPEEIPRLFKKFSRLVKSSDGAGLGLYLVKQIIQRHDGEVFCDSDSERGTTFSIRLSANL